jgi:hypothetical protein
MVALVERAEPGNQSDSEAAVTSVALFSGCPRRYYLSRYLGFEERRAGASAHAGETRAADDAAAEEPDETDATELGQQVHAVLAGAIAPGRISAEALHLVENFQASELGKQASDAETAAREQHLTFAIGGHLLRGQIDLWFEQGDRRVLVDYKTDQVDPGEARERLRTYGLQLQLYSLALEQAGGKRPTQAVAYFLRPNLALDVDVGERALEGAREAVRQFFAAQAKVEFPLRVGEHCLRCPHYRGLCPARLSSPGAAGEELSLVADGEGASAAPAPAPPGQMKHPRQRPADGQLFLPFRDE